MVACPGEEEKSSLSVWRSQEVPVASEGGAAVRGLLSSPGP